MDRGDASALADLKMHWDEAYVIGLDGDIWSARYRTSADELRAHTCTELRELIRSDYAYRQKIDRAAEDPDDDDEYGYYEGDAADVRDATLVTDGDLASDDPAPDDPAPDDPAPDDPAPDDPAPDDPAPDDPILGDPGSDNPADGGSGTRDSGPPDSSANDSGDTRQHSERVGLASIRGEGMSL
jgi:hypothetical protein